MKCIRIGMAAAGLLAIVLAGPLSAQTTTGALEGDISEKPGGVPVEGARVILIYTNNQSIRHEVLTNDKGHYYKGGIQPGMYQVTVEKEGFIPVSGTTRVGLGGSTRYDAALESLNSRIPEAVKIFRRGMRQLDGEKFAEASATFSEGVEADPENPLFHFYRGVAVERGGDLEGCRPDYRRAIELAPDFVLAYSRLGIVHAKLKQYEEAAEYYKQALDRGSEDVTTQYNYGVVLRNLSRNQEAGEVFEALLARDDGYADAMYQLGIIYLGQGDGDRARIYLERFLETDPQNPNAEIARKILENLN